MYFVSSATQTAAPNHFPYSITRARTGSSSNWLQEYFIFPFKKIIEFTAICLPGAALWCRSWCSSVLTTRCGFPGTQRVALCSHGRCLGFNLPFGMVSILLWFPLQCLSLFGNPWSIHAWVETVKSAFNARSKIWERSYQFHGSRCNGINLGCLRDTRIYWPNCKLHWPWNHFPHIWCLRAALRALLGVSRSTAAIADFYS